MWKWVRTRGCGDACSCRRRRLPAVALSVHLGAVPAATAAPSTGEGRSPDWVCAAPRPRARLPAAAAPSAPRTAASPRALSAAKPRGACAPRSARWSVTLSVAAVPRAASSFLQPPPYPPKGASSAPQDPAPRAKGAAKGHLPVPGGQDAPPSARSRAGISALFPPSGLDKDYLTVAGCRRAAESTAQPLKCVIVARNPTRH